MKRSIILHPVLLAVYPVLFLYALNVGHFSLSDVWAPLALTVAAALATWGALGLALGSFHKGGLIVSLGLALFFSYGHARQTIGEDAVIGLRIAWLLVFVVGSGLLGWTRIALAPLSQVVNTIAAVLVGFSIFDIAQGTMNERTRLLLESVPHVTIPGDEARPDIYFILLDAYGRADVLEKIYGYDNSPFLSALRERGFRVAERSTSNYMQTVLSLGSLFNVMYLDEFAKEVGEQSSSHHPLRAQFRENIVIEFLKRRGYEHIAFSSGVIDTEMPDADVYIDYGKAADTLGNALINMTPLPDVGWFTGSTTIFDEFRGQTLFTFDGLAKVVLRDSPKFVFAHIECPHPPFVFGPKGEPIEANERFFTLDGNWLIHDEGLTLDEYRAGYIDQVEFVNSRTLEAIDAILEKSEEPPIILLVGDHGPRSGFTWNSAEKTDQYEALSNLAAFHLPDGGHRGIYPAITPVNYFRVILSHYFGADLPRLPDRNYFSSARLPFHFTEVTERAQPWLGDHPEAQRTDMRTKAPDPRTKKLQRQKRREQRRRALREKQALEKAADEEGSR